MRIVIPANDEGLDAPVSSIFGRAPVFVFVDTDTLDVETLPNPAISAPGGAGIQAAQSVVEHGPDAVVCPRMGPNAFRVIQMAGIPAYVLAGTTVREAVEAFKAGSLSQLSGPGRSHVASRGSRF
ncbi:MAG: NifB/NifX family molybdenum-iron cluster-binding protein [Anaerolineae bacterium]